MKNDIKYKYAALTPSVFDPVRFVKRAKIVLENNISSELSSQAVFLEEVRSKLDNAFKGKIQRRMHGDAGLYI